jgi:hypothetical protein
MAAVTDNPLSGDYRFLSLKMFWSLVLGYCLMAKKFAFLINSF